MRLVAPLAGGPQDRENPGAVSRPKFWESPDAIGFAAWEAFSSALAAFSRRREKDHHFLGFLGTFTENPFAKRGKRSFGLWRASRFS